MGGAYSTHGREDEFVLSFLREPEGRKPLQYLDLEGRIILKYV
jgi:hypothetical protein